MLQLVAVCGLLLNSAAPANLDKDPIASVFTGAIEGEWKGTLEYRDYSNDKRVTLPTTLEARVIEEGRAINLKFRYDEGKNRFVESIDTFRINAKESTFTWESEGGKRSEYKLAGLAEFAARREGSLIITGQGIENKVDVEIRQTITLRGDEFKILKESKKPGSEFTFRNEYKFRRVTTP